MLSSGFPASEQQCREHGRRDSHHGEDDALDSQIEPAVEVPEGGEDQQHGGQVRTSASHPGSSPTAHRDDVELDCHPGTGVETMPTMAQSFFFGIIGAALARRKGTGT